MADQVKLTRKPASVKLIYQKNYTEEPVRQIEYEIIYVENATGSFFCENSSLEVKNGDFIFINSFEEHYFKAEIPGVPMSFYRFVFDISDLGSPEDICRKFFEGIRLCRYLKMPEWLSMRLKDAAKLKNVDERKPVILRSILFDFISFSIESEQYERFSQLSTSEKRSISAIDNSLKYIKEFYNENLNLEQLLQLTNYSRSHFIRLFKESTGMNISEYINKYRIEKACLDLIYTSNNITEIATANGFNNIQYFSRKFKEYMNCTPKQYQKKRKKLTER